jgi:hypothetical protein
MRVNIAMRNQSGLLSNIGQFSKELFQGLCPQIVLLLSPVNKLDKMPDPGS